MGERRAAAGKRRGEINELEGPPITLLPDQNCSRIWATSPLRKWGRPCRVPGNTRAYRLVAQLPPSSLTATPDSPRPPRARQRHRGPLRKKGCNNAHRVNSSTLRRGLGVAAKTRPYRSLLEAAVGARQRSMSSWGADGMCARNGRAEEGTRRGGEN